MKNKIKELVNNSEIENKSELVEYLEQLDVPSIPNLEEIFKNEKFAGLRNEINKREGSLRTKWDEEIKEKTKKEQTMENTEKQPEGMEIILEKLKTVENMFAEINQQKEISNLKSLVDTKLKDFPAELKKLIVISKNSTEEEILQQIESTKEIYKSLKGSEDKTPYKSTGGKTVDTEFEQILKNNKNFKQ